MIEMALLFATMFWSAPLFAHAQEANLYVNGFVLGEYPALGEGFSFGPKLKKSENRCFTVDSKNARGSSAMVSFAPVDRVEVKDRILDNYSYPATDKNSQWWSSASGPAGQFYKAVLAEEPSKQMVEYMFMPLAVDSEGRVATRAQLTFEAAQRLEKMGPEALRKWCGDYVVQGIYSSAFVLYSVRFQMDDEAFKDLIEKNLSQTKYRMPDELLQAGSELLKTYTQGAIGLDPKVHVDILQFGGPELSVKSIEQRLRQQGITPSVEKIMTASNSYAQRSCRLNEIDSCMFLIKTYLDLQFGGVANADNSKPQIPLRFQLTPLNNWLSGSAETSVQLRN